MVFLNQRLSQKIIQPIPFVPMVLLSYHLKNIFHFIPRSLMWMSGITCSNPYGERQRLASTQGVIPIFLSKAIAGDSVVIWGDGTTTEIFCISLI